MSENDLKIEIYARHSDGESYTEVEVIKPKGMTLAEALGRIEQAKFQLLMQSVVSE